jgi:hypothetical protein
MSGYPDLATWWLQLRLFEQWLHVIGALCVVYVCGAHWSDSRKWRRLVRVCGSEAKALDVVAMEEMQRAGFRGANRRGWIHD